MDPSKKIVKFFAQFKTHAIKKGRTFLKAGDTPRGVYFIKKGYARIYSVSSGGKELTLVIYQPGEFFPVVWTFTSKPSIYYYEALSDLEISIAPRLQFVKFTKENPDVYEEVLRGIIERFQNALKRMQYLTFGNVRSRIASVFLIYAERFGVKKVEGEIQLPVPFTHSDIANIVGVARETVSIEIKKFLDGGIIGHTGRFFIIKNKRRLAAEASQL
ncbi:MAG: Crp/Fnr family transcriptional regulator [Candidatus Levybacteria bacterium]|nr:Crp/Fnr family transcriptional regulator [Candidatus Levybacteria bacterium]